MRATMKTLRQVVVFALALAPLTLVQAFEDSTVAAWVQYTAAGVEARAVVKGDCPSIRINRQPVAMKLRADVTGDHPNRVCAAVLPERVRSLELQGQALPVPVENPQRIVIVGDTGCRLSDDHGLYQECDNDAIWPFQYVAQSVADYRPDLILYTGDYIYREDACPEGNSGCEASPYGDNETTWRADWMDPARPMQLAAPMILVRGNHEICSRAGTGWFRYMDAFAHSDICVDNTPAWSVSLDKLDIGVIDSGRVKDEDDQELTELFAAQLQELKPRLGRNAWIATHRPFWGFGADDDSGELITPTGTLQDAVDAVGLPQGTNLLVSAHIHLAEVIGFQGDRPPQMVVANGGTQLVPRVDPPEEIDGVAIDVGLVLYQYGFVSMESGAADRQWRAGFRDLEGRELEVCQLDSRRVSCRETRSPLSQWFGPGRFTGPGGGAGAAD